MPCQLCGTEKTRIIRIISYYKPIDRLYICEPTIKEIELCDNCLNTVISHVAKRLGDILLNNLKTIDIVLIPYYAQTNFHEKTLTIFFTEEGKTGKYPFHSISQLPKLDSVLRYLKNNITRIIRIDVLPLVEMPTEEEETLYNTMIGVHGLASEPVLIAVPLYDIYLTVITSLKTRETEEKEEKTETKPEQKNETKPESKSESKPEEKQVEKQ